MGEAAATTACAWCKTTEWLTLHRGAWGETVCGSCHRRHATPEQWDHKVPGWVPDDLRWVWARHVLGLRYVGRPVVAQRRPQ